MKGKIFLAINAAVFAVAAACGVDTSYPVAPVPTFGVTVNVLADGLTYSSDAGAIPAATRSVHLVAQVSGPPGDWPLSLAADGAFALGGDGGTGLDGGAITSTVHIDPPGGSSVPVDVQVTAAPLPVGEAVVTASFGTLTRSFRFVVAPLVPTLQICAPDMDAGCQGPPGAIADAGPPFVDDAGALWIPFPDSPGSWRDGDRAALVVSSDVLPGQEGVAWTGTVTTDGVLWLVDEGTTTRTRTIQFTQGGGPVVTPVVVVGSGTGYAWASIAGGPQAAKVVQTASASVVPRRVELLGYAGLQTRNKVTLCSTRSSGSLGASLDLDGGSVSPAVAPLTAAPGGPCADPYPGQADFVWTGRAADSTLWSVKDESADAGDGALPVVVSVPTLGTPVGAALAQPATVTWLADAGVPTDGGSGALAQVSGTLVRTLNDKSTQPLDGTSLVVTGPAGVDVVTAMPLTTDANGDFSFSVTRESWLAGAAVPLTLTVDQAVSLPITLQ